MTVEPCAFTEDAEFVWLQVGPKKTPTIIWELPTVGFAGAEGRICAPKRVQYRIVPAHSNKPEPGNKQEISVPGLGDVELTGEYLDYMPALRVRPEEPLDPQKNEFRIVSPVLIRGNEVVFNLGGSDSTDSGDPDAALMIYFPGEGRYLISTVPFEGAVDGKVELGQIKFRLEGQNYVLLTAMPTTRSEHIWVAHDPRYKLSQHMEGASDSRDMFMVRSLSRLLEEQIHH